MGVRQLNPNRRWGAAGVSWAVQVRHRDRALPIDPPASISAVDHELCSASDDHTIKKWDTVRLKKLFSFKGMRIRLGCQVGRCTAACRANRDSIVFSMGQSDGQP